MPDSNQHSSRAAAFEQWSQGGGRSDATWEITRAEAALIFAELRAKITRAEDAERLADKRYFDLVEQLDAERERADKSELLLEANRITTHDFVSMKEQLESLRDALEANATRKDGDGQLCWCSTTLRAGLFKDEHSGWCQKARAALASNPAGVPHIYGAANTTNESSPASVPDDRWNADCWKGYEDCDCRRRDWRLP